MEHRLPLTPPSRVWNLLLFPIRPRSIWIRSALRSGNHPLQPDRSAIPDRSRRNRRPPSRTLPRCHRGNPHRRNQRCNRPLHSLIGSRPPPPGRKNITPQDKDFRGERFTNQTHRSRTDHDARLYRKAHGKESRLSFIGSFLADTKSRVILDTCAGIPGIDTESSMAVEMLYSLDQRGILHAVQILTADAHYGNTGFLCELNARGVTPHIPPLFDETPESIPQWKTRAHQPERQDKRDERIREVHVRNRAREIVQTVGYKVSQKLRKRSEHLFAEAKGCHGLGRARGRGIARLKEQLNMTAVAQNIKRMVSFCSRMDRKKAASRLSSLSLAAAESIICRLSRSFSPFHHFILSVRALMV